MMDNDFPSGLGFLQAYTRGMSDYSQSGDVIPDLRVQNQYAKEFGGPVVEQTKISRDPSFEIEPVDIDSSQVDEWLRQMRSAPGYQPPTISLPQLQRNIQRLRSSLKPV